jgi:hypothetical protein
LLAVLGGQGVRKPIASKLGEFVSREIEVLCEEEVFIFDRVTKADRIIGADCADDPSVEKLADGVFIR